jgi:CheY-like chemotaxis protein
VSSYSGQTVLVADDSDDVRELVAMELRLSGYEVVEAKDGAQAVELAKQSRPALILMDVSMPGMDGLSAARLIRSIKELCRVVIVAFSAHASGGSRRLALESGCDDYVNKTEGIKNLRAVVQRHLPAA